MPRSAFFQRLNRRDARAVRFRHTPSFFTFVLVTLAFLFWSYFQFTRGQIGQCTFASDWATGWFDYGSPLQLFAISFSAVFLLWVVSLFSPSRGYGVIEAALQGIFIIGFLVSLGFVKAMIMPFSFPSFHHAQTIADYLFPITHDYYEEEVAIFVGKRPKEWPYDFPPPPPYPYLREWLDGYDREPKQIFRSDQSPSRFEIDEMIRCSQRFRARLADRERAARAHDDWNKEYGWRIEPQYFLYRVPQKADQDEDAN